MKRLIAFARRHPTASLCVGAFLAMCVQDLAGTVMVISESRLNAGVAAGMDQLGFMAQVLVTVFGLGDVIREKRITRRATAVFLAISAGNIIATYAGVDGFGHLLVGK